MIGQFLDNIEPTTILVAGITIGIATCLVISPLYFYVKNSLFNENTSKVNSDATSSVNSDITSSSSSDASSINETASEGDNTTTDTSVNENNDQISNSELDSDTISENSASNVLEIINNSSSTCTSIAENLSPLAEEDAVPGEDIYLENYSVPSDGLVLELSNILSLPSVEHQLDTLLFILPFVSYLSKDSCMAIQEWCQMGSSLELNPDYLHNIIQTLELLMSTLGY